MGKLRNDYRVHHHAAQLYKAWPQHAFYHWSMVYHNCSWKDTVMVLWCLFYLVAVFQENLGGGDGSSAEYAKYFRASQVFAEYMWLQKVYGKIRLTKKHGVMEEKRVFSLWWTNVAENLLAREQHGGALFPRIPTTVSIPRKASMDKEAPHNERFKRSTESFQIPCRTFMVPEFHLKSYKNIRLLYFWW